MKMLQLRNLALELLLVVAGFNDHAFAARTPRQREEQCNRFPTLPPGADNMGEAPRPPKALGELDFTLRHIYHHGAQRYPQLHRYIDVPPDAHLQVSSDDGETQELAPRTLRAKAVTTNIQRLAKRRKTDIDTLLEHAAIHGQAATLQSTAWTVDEIAGPNVTDKETVLSFARMANNAYILEPNTGDWMDVGGGFNYTEDFGWESQGLRGHIFVDKTNGTVVIGLKGTSPAIFDGSDTTGNDKLNDNLFGSCCCGQGGQLLWKQVCDCMTSTYTCNNTCLVKSLREKSHYYWAVRDLYHNVTERYPQSEVWLSGHSLGGVVSALLGLTYGLATMTFEAFPDALAASRLGLPTPPGYRIGSHQTRTQIGIHHFGHTADPIFMGSCNAASSFCTFAGYAFQGVCHTGSTCVYDTVGDLGWRVGVGTHKITNVIKNVLEVYDHVPACEEDVECQDCYNWKFYKSNGTETTSTSSSTSTRTSTRTETCKTPGWWGCLDESTTTSGSTTSTSTSSASTSTCKTPGWFGCKDPTTTTSSSSTPATTPSAAPAPTITSSNPTPSTTCKTLGWLGCNDPTSYTISAKPSSTVEQTTASATASCTSKDWFGLICVDPSPTSTPAPGSSSVPSGRRVACIKRRWYGGCKQWDFESDEAKLDL